MALCAADKLYRKRIKAMKRKLAAGDRRKEVQELQWRNRLVISRNEDEDHPRLKAQLRTERAVRWAWEERSAYEKGGDEALRAVRLKHQITQATPAWANRGRIMALHKRAYRLTRLRGHAYGVVHIVPICGPLVCGLNWEENMRVVLL